MEKTWKKMTAFSQYFYYFVVLFLIFECVTFGVRSASLCVELHQLSHRVPIMVTNLGGAKTVCDNESLEGDFFSIYFYFRFIFHLRHIDV